MPASSLLSFVTETRSDPSAGDRRVICITVPEDCALKIFYCQLCYIQNEAKITNHFKERPLQTLSTHQNRPRSPSRST
jgi:hypothetical protein